MLNKMRTDNVDVVSDSWGLCELFVPAKLTANENTALELLAVHDASFYVASGDDGAADCRSSNPGAKFLAIDDPSGQPFATAVGGTNLQTSVHGPREGLDGLRRRHLDQLAQAGIPGRRDLDRTCSPAASASSGHAQCRVTPDIAMDAAPQTGYIIRSRGLGGGATAVWDLVGGTSGAAPLMAGITADANEDAEREPRLRKPVHLPGPPGRRLHTTSPRATTRTAPAPTSRPKPDSTW